ncbi:MAG TPA: VOC family protein [Thermoanaerobaculia bacterium]|nr:VOC family protein [Thermoanaerobaculia bacterium]
MKKKPGTINWIDLTVPDASLVRDFYREVVGWDSVGLDMGGYDDYCMNVSGTEETVVGICHARGANAAQPAQWMVYINVADLDASLAAVKARGGELLSAVRTMPGQGRYCVIQDPAGAVAALYEDLTDSSSPASES